MCVLLVEDEAVIRELMAEALSAVGREILEVASGEEAIAVIDARCRAFSALVTDLNMPGRVDGTAVARRMRTAYPGIPVVLATGRPDILPPDWLREEGYVVLNKPYKPSDLIGVIDRLCGGSA